MSPSGYSDPQATPPREAPGGGVGFGLRRSWPFFALAFGLFGVGLAFWRPIPAGVWHDDGVYMLIGKALSQGQGLTYFFVPGDLPAVKFPPLYSGILAALWWAFGGVGPVTLAAGMLNLALMAAAGALLAWALHDGADLRRREAVVIAGVAFVSADVWRPALIPLSEPLFMALAAAVFALWPRATRSSGLRGLAGMALILVAAVLTRSAAAALVAGVGLALFLRRGPGVAAAVTAPALAAMVGWGMWAGARAEAIPEGMRDVLGPYGGWLTDQILGSPGAFLQGLPGHANAVVGRVLALLVPGLVGWPLWVAAVPLGVAALVGGRALHRTLPPLPWVALAYAAMLLVWPFVDRRLVAPLHPWAVAAVGMGVVHALRRLSPGRLRQAVAAVAFAWVASYAAVTASRATRGWAVAGYQLRAGRLAAAVEALSTTAPPDATVGAPEFWAALHLHGGWRVAPSARFTPRGEDAEIPVWGTPEDQLELWWGAGIDHLLLEQGGQVHGDALNLLEQRCPGSAQILARMPPQILVRIDWSAECGRALGLPAGPRSPSFPGSPR